ncbi:MAG: hypothetical protein IJV07_04205 [Alphaproteobacteria bacterium]|nr:hypothetical protein [Alphaproteobacteria bacterium]
MDSHEQFKQSGRSMVEMLGTLAIMGVLTIGGVAGYRYAIVKQSAQEVIQSVSLMAVSASTQLTTTNTFSLSEFDAQIMGAYPVEGLETYGNGPLFAIRVSQIPADICRQILRMNWRQPVEIAVQNQPATVENLDLCQSENTMDFVFTDTLTGKDKPEHCQRTSDCSSACDACINGLCVENCAAGQSCVYRTNGRQKATDKTICCPDNQIMNGICCSSVTYDSNTGQKLCCVGTNASKACCPEGYFRIDNKCYSCDDPAVLRTVFDTNTICAVCPQRSLAAWQCVTTCPDSDQVVQDGHCWCPDDKPIMDQYGHCYPCDSGKGGVWGVSTLALRNSGVKTDVCRQALFCGNHHCGGGYTNPCPAGKIGTSRHSYEFKLKDGSSVPDSSYGFCYDCADVDISTIRLESQCRICGGTWTGENWFTGTCRK